jgi:hypothetical protein
MRPELTNYAEKATTSLKALSRSEISFRESTDMPEWVPKSLLACSEPLSGAALSVIDNPGVHYVSSSASPGIR